MAISFIAASANGGQSITTMPSHAAGDILIIWNCTISAAPAVPDGWAILSRAVINTTHYALAYKIATSDSEVSGTWTGTHGDDYSSMGCVVYRSDAGKQLSVGNFSNTGGDVGSGGNISYLANIPSGITEKWQVGMVCHRVGGTDIEVAPTGMTARCHAAGAFAGKMAMHDSNGNDAAWPTTTYTLTSGSSGAYRTHVLELVELGVSSIGGTARPVNPFTQQVIG